MKLRPSVRLRLTLLYGGLFLLTGTLLLAVNYALVSARLPGEPSRVTVAPRFAPGTVPLPEAGAPDHLEFVLPVDPGSPEGQQIEEAFAKGIQDYRRRTLDTLLVQSASALGLLALASIGLGWVVAGRVLRPLNRITATARHLSEQNLHERIDLDGPDDELKELADTFDGMLARLDAAFSAQSRFIANASHELRTPLAIQRTLVDVSLAGPGRSPEDLVTADKLREAIGRSERLIDSLLVLARSERRIEEWTSVDLARAAAEALAASAPEADARRLRIERHLEAAVACGDPPLVERVVGNLVDNAVRHNVDGGEVKVVTRSGPDGAVLAVTNTGPQIRPDEVARLFEPFRRLEGDRTRSVKGSGLGLSIVRAVVETHGGAVGATPRNGGGLEVEVILPTARPKTSA